MLLPPLLPLALPPPRGAGAGLSCGALPALASQPSDPYGTMRVMVEPAALPQLTSDAVRMSVGGAPDGVDSQLCVWETGGGAPILDALWPLPPLVGGGPIAKPGGSASMELRNPVAAVLL